MTLPRIGVTLGDPGGIGPEIILKTFAGKERLPAADYIIFGSSALLKKEEKALGIHLPLFPPDKGKLSRRSLTVHEIEAPPRSGKRGMPSAENGAASFLFFQTALKEAREGRLQAVVTAPVSKTSWALAGLRWRGHTDYLAPLYPRAIMAFWSSKLKVALLSHHLPLRDALKKIKRKDLLDFFLSLHFSLKNLRPEGFDFLVAGLNPHAGEEGLLGREEVEEIAPAVRAAQKRGLRIRGPYPPDVIFRSAVGRKDAFVIALYHDQGLIPFKLAAFDTGVNVSLGLPFVRTSPDHGTAFDIAGKNAASPKSLIAAIRLAALLR
ncbi:MAG: 4-hydroxythreonine-4-phosphate dehydrogenase PdxA [Acidobacteriota bacterium]